MDSKNNDQLMFNDFCTVCEKINSARRDKKAEILQKFIFSYKTKNETSFYRVLRLLLPQLDRERAAYGIKEFTLAKIYVRILCLHPESADALRLKNFRAPKNAGSSAGDFGEVAYWVLKSRCSGGNVLTLDDVHRHLDTIALRHAEKKPREVDKELEVMLHRMSAMEQKWLVRIVLKDMRLGLGTGRVLSAFHPDARELYDYTNSLQQVCDKLKDPSCRLHEVEISLFTPCRPMLAERCDVQDIEKHFSRQQGLRYVETKLDGERSQLHYCNGQFKFFSRNAFEFTDAFGSTSSSGSLTPYLAKQLKPKVKSCILDGEMMPWNTKHKCFGSKGMNLDVKSLRIGNVHQPCFCVFDILYFNDSVLTNKPLRERLSILDQVFTSLEGIMMHTPRKEVSSGEEVLEALNNAIDNLEEGIVVKEPDSVYKPNSRRGGWIKIKPEYTAGAMVELDLLIVGGYYGEGRRRGLVSHFLLALAQPPSTPGDPPTIFETVARVGSGCTLDELATLGRQLESHWKKWQADRPPTHLCYSREKPQLWIEPVHSVILQVKASEVVRSDFYATGYTLRFPRIEKVRYDKPWTDCLTTAEFTSIRMNASGSLVGAHISQQSPRAKKRRAVHRSEPTVAAHFRNIELDGVTPISRLFEDRELCVLTGLPEMNKQQLECMIVENGGKVVLNPGNTTYCILVGEEDSLRVVNVCRKGSYDVVRVQWLLNSLDAGRLLPWTPADIISSSPATAEWLATEYDRYGDSYTQPADIHSLRHSLTQVGEKKTLETKRHLKKMLKLDKLLFGGCSPLSFFRGCVAYFDYYAQVGDISTQIKSPLDSFYYNFRFFSGHICTDITEETSHIMLHTSELDRLEELIDQAARHDKKAHIIQHYWLVDCIERRALLAEEKYLLHQWTDSV